MLIVITVLSVLLSVLAAVLDRGEIELKGAESKDGVLMNIRLSAIVCSLMTLAISEVPPPLALTWAVLWGYSIVVDVRRFRIFLFLLPMLIFFQFTTNVVESLAMFTTFLVGVWTFNAQKVSTHVSLVNFIAQALGQGDKVTTSRRMGRRVIEVSAPVHTVMKQCGPQHGDWALIAQRLPTVWSFVTPVDVTGEPCREVAQSHVNNVMEVLVSKNHVISKAYYSDKHIGQSAPEVSVNMDGGAVSFKVDPIVLSQKISANTIVSLVKHQAEDVMVI